MINAGIFICSQSTFCLNAGITNIHDIVIIPSIGAWIDLHLLSNRNNDQYIIISNSSLLPSNVVVIDTDKSGFHCASIDNYGWFDEIKEYWSPWFHLSTYRKKLGEYLVSH